MIECLLIYLLVINVVACVYYAADKYRAKKHLRRVPESTLLLLAFVGGALGAFIAMQLFRHKTRHSKFKILVPLLSILWIILTIYILTC